MATFTVTNLNDSGAGSLREAITNANAAAGPDTVQFQVGLTGTLVLTSGQLVIADDLTINGDNTGDNKADITISGNLESRVFMVSDFAAYTHLNSLTLTEGLASYGGAIFAAKGTSLYVSHTTVSGSYATLGGGIATEGALFLDTSTVSDNYAFQGGGGIFVESGGGANIYNSTIDGNFSRGIGGGVLVGIGTGGAAGLTLISSTVTDNTAIGGGGGIALGKDSYLRAENTVIALNTAVINPTVHEWSPGQGQIAAENSFLGTAVSIDVDDGGNFNGGGDPLLGKLQDNGGTVWTRNIDDGSPLINAGGTTVLANDANGDSRVSFGKMDIGATEFSGPLVVTTASDIVANDGFLSLREAMALSSTDPSAGPITFAASLKGQTITLTGGELAISTDMVIDGDVDGDNKADITISGNNASRIFLISGGNTVDVEFLSLTLTGGTADRGGAIFAQTMGTLTVSDSTLTGNAASVLGGAIAASDSDVIIDNSLIEGNSAGYAGGGLSLSASSKAWLQNATVYGNSSAQQGGGIAANNSYLVVRASTITNNHADTDGLQTKFGGGIANVAISKIYVQSSIVMDNTSGTSLTSNDMRGGYSSLSSSFGSGSGLAVLADNGGTVHTQAIRPDSPFINTGDNFVVNLAGLTTDANGNDRIVGGVVDRGATEFRLVVDTELDIVANDGKLSLREALAITNSNPNADLISFDSSLAGKTIVLSSQLQITADVTIDGDTNGDDKADITLSGGNANGILRSTGAGTDLSVRSLTLTNGAAVYGGAIYAGGGGTLQVSHSTISNSSGSSFGGGIFTFGDAYVANSTFSGNSAGAGGGGGIYSRYGYVVLMNTTVHGNSTTGLGGGIKSGLGDLVVINSTITGNQADTDGGQVNAGGGIALVGNTLSMANNVVAENSSSTGKSAHEIAGSVTSSSNSFFGAAVTINSGSGNINGGGIPLLGELLDNGGTVLTRSPLDGSPLIGKGSNAQMPFDIFDVDGDGDTSEILPLDGRGGVRIVDGTVDIGAVEQIIAEIIRGTDGKNVIIGGNGGDQLFGLGGDDVITGGNGNDLVEGGKGADTMDGNGSPSDTLSYATSSGGVTINLASNSASGGDATGDIISNFENVTGSNRADNLIGTTGNNIMIGLSGSDVMNGGDGDDTIIGGFSADTLIGGGGSGDTLSYLGSSGVNINLEAGTASGGHATGDVYSGFENLTGSNGKDVLAGDAQANIIKGLDGTDVIFGSVGADILDGGKGKDTLSYAGSSSGVAVNLATNTASGGDASGDVIFSFENLAGSNHGDSLTGTNFRNVMNGAGGADRIDGGGKIDTLTGGADADTFVLSSLYADRDIITDFGFGADVLEINAASFAGGAFLVAGALNPFLFRINTTGLAGDGDDRFIYDSDDGKLYYDQNGTGLGGSRLIATFTNLAVLDAGDFIIV